MYIVKYMKFLICLGILLLLVIQIANSTDFTSDKETFFGKAISEKILNIENFHSYIVSNEYLIIKSTTNDSTLSKITVVNALTMEEVWSVTIPFFYYFVSMGDNPCLIVHEVIDEGILLSSAFNVSNGELFLKKQFVGSILPSPNGEYFVLEVNDLIGNSFTIYDRTGKIIYTDNKTGYWSTDFFNDSIVIIGNSKSLRFLSIPKKEVVLEIEKPNVDCTDYTPIMKIKNNGNEMIIAWCDNLYYVNSDLELVWQRFEPYINNLTFNVISQDQIAIIKNRRKEFHLSIYDKQSGKLLVSDSFQFNNGVSSHPGTSQNITFINNIVRYTPRYGSQTGEGHKQYKPITYFFDLNNTEDSKTSGFIIEDACQIIKTDSSFITIEPMDDSEGLKITTWD